MRSQSLLATVVAALVLAALGLTVGCGGRPSSPEALFEEIARRNEAGQTSKIWDLYTDDGRKNFVDAVDGYRAILRKNPAEEKLTRQWKCTRAEFMELSYVELFRRENLGNERALVGAKIVDKQVNPRNPAEVFLVIEPPAGPKVILLARQVEGGWALVEMTVKIQ